MVETRMRTAMAARAPATNARLARLEMLKKANATPRVKVMPANDAMRRMLEHPSGIGFHGSGGAEWPLDRFTRRRLKEGAIVLAEKAEKAKPAESKRSEPEPAEESAWSGNRT
jgi:hypothetical protein